MVGDAEMQSACFSLMAEASEVKHIAKEEADERRGAHHVECNEGSSCSRFRLHQIDDLLLDDWQVEDADSTEDEPCDDKLRGA